jgi:hypothetical protein
MSSNCTIPQHGERLSQTVCLPPAANTLGESLAALAGGGQGEGSDMLRGELSHPIGFWFTCHDLLAFLPSDVVRQERRA